ncbi:MAG: MmgE/PrpD family protein, partial [Paracoccus sp. (in: a-proteobacteria)]
MTITAAAQPDPTGALVGLAQMAPDQMPADVLRLARLSLLDWLICGIAGRSEPVAQALRHHANSESGPDAGASLFGGGMASARLAALANGTISHALDYDDTHFDHVGHLSVGIYPAVLALAEQDDLTVAQMSEAFLVGAEGAIRLGRVLGAAHYNRGFHQTATAGAFGATMAAGRLAGLDADAMRRALGLCATRASGLKSQFGTMGKPLNAGLSASNGVEAVQLAMLGLSTASDGIFGPQGFVETHSDSPDLTALDAGLTAPGTPDFRFRDNRYKFHACCHGLHAMIEGLLALLARTPIAPGDVARISVQTAPRWLRVCDIKQPRTGLEVKFSYGWLAGMVLTGRATGDDRVYADELAADVDLAGLAARVEVTG